MANSAGIFVNGRNVGLGEVIAQNVTRELTKITDYAKWVVDEAAQNGKSQVRLFVNSSGTPESGKQGRVASGDMLDDVDYALGVIDTEKEYMSAYGWLGPFPAPTYYHYQEGGFYHIWAQRDVEGMYALRAAAELSALHIKDELGGNIRL